VRSLLEKIKESAAKHLTLPAGRKPAQELNRYRRYLKVETLRLRILHRGGGGGRQVCQARAAMLDELLCHLVATVQACHPPPPGKPHPELALVAIGGYGRGELNPQSDIDIMFLHPFESVSRSNPHPWLTLVTEGILYDLGLKVGYSVRSIADCVQVANADMQSKTSLLESRLITGDAKLFERLQSAVLARCVVGHEAAYIESRVLDQATRHAKNGSSPTLQEPNIKNGCGGLRDYQNLHWMVYVKYRTRTTEEMVKKELISDGEARQLDAGYDYLLRARNELHYQANRPVDALTKSFQPSVALRLGYTDRSPSRRLEAFMSEYFKHTRNLFLITRTVEQRLALLPKPPGRFDSLRSLFRSRRPTETPVVDGFRIVDGRIHAASKRVFDDQPRRLIRVFLYAQQRGLELHPDLVSLLRGKLPLLDRKFLADAGAHETFLEILNQRGNVAPVLRAMHEVGVLGKYLPEFGRLTNLVQHEFYHQYTADEHTLLCLQKLDAIASGKQENCGFYTSLMHQVEQPYVLYLAMLLHDAGKKEGNRDHAGVGERLARGVARRLKLEGPTTQALCLLIKNHLLMSHVSQRRDLGDPVEIKGFTETIRNRNNLGMLTLHTVADTLATSDKLWNGFKDTLIQTLFLRADHLLAGGKDFRRDEERQWKLLRQEVRPELPKSISEDEVDGHFNKLPLRYFQIHSVRQIANDITIAHQFMVNQLTEEDKALEPVVHWHNEIDRGYTEVKICTWDRAGLFCKTTGCFSAAGLNILAARIYTRADGIALDTFYVTDAQTGTVASREQRENFEKYLGTVLGGGAVDFSSLIARQRGGRPLYQSLEGERIPTSVRLLNDLSDRLTVIDIETEDRLGLLYAVSQVLAEKELDIDLAKIGTEKGAAVDSFYVSYAEGGKIESPSHQQAILHDLLAAIEKLEEP
jgi:[protein-PII] uridylyltransferase